MAYVMGFVQAVPTANKEAYRQFAEQSVPLFERHGAKRLFEGWGDDVAHGDKTDFYRAVDARDDETVVFSFQTFSGKAAADAASREIMEDPEMADMGDAMPFDGSRMIYGGFQPISEVQREAGTTGYVEGSLIPVPASARQAYADYTRQMSQLFIEYGAVRSVDAWGEFTPDGKVTDFKKAVDAGEDEAVVFGWIEWSSREVRDAAWSRLMNDPRMQVESDGFDESRRVFGGFVPLLDVTTGG